MPLVLELTSSPTDEACSLIEELEAELSGSFSREQRHGFSAAKIFQPNILFFVARLDGEVVGCGGIAIEDGWAEVKRMYVRPRLRGQGIGQTILDRLEEEARGRGINRLVLETGDVLAPAIAMYKRAGFTRCEAFGAYLAMPAKSIERSVFLEKKIG